MRVFLGGTCGAHDYRDKVIPQLQCDYFNPHVANWTKESRVIEEQEKERCDKLLYVFTSEMRGYYGIAEVVDCSYKFKGKIVLCILYSGFGDVKRESLEAVEELCARNGVTVLRSLDDVVSYLNEQS